MSNWLMSLFGKSLDVDQLNKGEFKEAYFTNIIVVDKTPELDSIKAREFIKVIYKRKPYWAIFRCPCGCSTLITLPLQKSVHHFWKVYKSKYDRPTVYPSIWQNKGCYSHFIINDGKIFWCQNSGFEPYSWDES